MVLDLCVRCAVTGSRGIGASCVEMLGRRGASVGFSYISNATAAQDLVKAVAVEGLGAAAGFQADVVDQAAMEVAMEASVAQFGRPLDGLVCSAGVFEPTPIASWNTPYQVSTAWG